MSCTYSTSPIDEIKNRLSIQEIFDQCFPFQPLTKRGNRLWSRCPFHDEKTPSFFLDTLKDRFTCHGCHVHGDQIDLYALANHLTLREAIRHLAAQVGITRDITPREKTKLQVARAKQERQAAINQNIENALRLARLDCWAMERWFYSLKRHIYHERDLDRSGPALALRNLLYIEHLGDIFLSGTDVDKLRAAKAYRGWEECQKTAGLRL